MQIIPTYKMDASRVKTSKAFRKRIAKSHALRDMIEADMTILTDDILFFD